MLYEVNNRGMRLVFTYFNGKDIGYQASDAGNGFVMRHGYTAVWSGWLTPANATANAARTSDPPPLFADLPIATNQGAPLVGASREEWIGGDKGQVSGRLSYPAATLDRGSATLTYRQLEGDQRQPLADWSYADERTVKITPPPGSGAGTIYEFIYPARDPVVMGLGYAAVREVVSFLRHSPADDAGHPNPLFVNGRAALKVAVSTGTSQSGAMQRDFLYQGFNADRAGRKVFDGMNPIVGAARRRFVNARFAQPGRTTTQHESRMYPMDDFPFTYGTTTDVLTGKTDGLLARCSKSNTCPHIVQLDTDTEPYVSHGSLVLTDTRGRMVTLPDSVRYYYVTTAHLQNAPGCRDAPNTISPYPYYRAAFENLVRWVRDGVPPPPTAAPSATDGTFVTVVQQSHQYPRIPGRAYNFRINELGVRDYSVLPPAESAMKYPLFVPRLNQDGNPAVGIIIPEIIAPVATISGRAILGRGAAEGDLCFQHGSSIPFPKTKAERLASGDSRLSLEERYPGGQVEYAAKYTRALEKLIADRYLLPEERTEVVPGVVLRPSM